MGLGVDENWRAYRVAIGNPLCRQAVDELPSTLVVEFWTDPQCRAAV